MGCGQDVAAGAEVEMHIVLCLWGPGVQVSFHGPTALASRSGYVFSILRLRRFFSQFSESSRCTVGTMP